MKIADCQAEEHLDKEERAAMYVRRVFQHKAIKRTAIYKTSTMTLIMISDKWHHPRGCPQQQAFRRRMDYHSCPQQLPRLRLLTHQWVQMQTTMSSAKRNQVSKHLSDLKQLEKDEWQHSDCDKPMLKFRPHQPGKRTGEHLMSPKH